MQSIPAFRISFFQVISPVQTEARFILYLERISLFVYDTKYAGMISNIRGIEPEQFCLRCR